MRYARSQIVLALGLLLACSTGCKTFKRSYLFRSHQVRKAPMRLVPLKDGDQLQKLELNHFEPSSVFVPAGTRWARPVIIAMHGQADSPDMNCRAWRHITDKSYFILCPALQSKAVLPDKPAQDCSQWECAAAELKEALIALRKRFGVYVVAKQVVLAGFDRGALFAVPIAQQDPKVFPIVWLIDGGLQAWSSALSTTFVDRGGKLLGVACTKDECQNDLRRVVTSAHATGLKVAEFHVLRERREFDVGLATGIKSIWESARPHRWPWVTPDAHKAKH